MLLRALEGLDTGSPNRKVAPTERSLAVLSGFAKHENCEIADLGKRILKAWQEPMPRK
jgi:hypothetical protein